MLSIHLNLNPTVVDFLLFYEVLSVKLPPSFLVQKEDFFGYISFLGWKATLPQIGRSEPIG